MQTEGQSANDFISKLRAVGSECEFPNFAEAIMDWLLVGLRDEKLVSELLVKDNLTLELAIKEVLAKEQAIKEAQMMKSSNVRDSANKVGVAFKSKHSKNSMNIES